MVRFNGTVTVLGARLDEKGRWLVGLEGVPEGGSESLRLLHSFPADTLDWRAVEYGLDPNDIARLLEIVLHEPHMDEHGPDDPDFLYNTDTATARTALLARVAATKKRVTIVDPHGHLATIHDAHTAGLGHPGRHGALARKRAHVEAVRSGGSGAAHPSPTFTNRSTDD